MASGAPASGRSLTEHVAALHARGRYAGVVQTFRARFPSGLLYGHRMYEQVWVADALAALGRFAEADRFVRHALKHCNNPLFDPRPIVMLQLGRLRAAARMVRFDLERARRMAWQARAWMESYVPAARRTPEHADVADVRALLGLVDGLVAEAEGRYADAAEALEATLPLLAYADDIKPRVRGAWARVLARTEPAAALQTRLDEEQLVDGDAVYALTPRWLGPLLDDAPELALQVVDSLPRPIDPSTAIDRVRARLDEVGPEAAARALMAALGERARVGLEVYQRAATWRAEAWRRLDEPLAAVEALSPLLAEPPESGWPLIAHLTRLEIVTGSEAPATTGLRGLEPALAPLRCDADAAVAMVAWALTSRARRLSGELDGAVAAARRAVGLMAGAARAPLAWLLPPAWPTRGLAIDTYRLALATRVAAGPETDAGRWCARVLPRVDAFRARRRRMGLT